MYLEAVYINSGNWRCDVALYEKDGAGNWKETEKLKIGGGESTTAHLDRSNTLTPIGKSVYKWSRKKDVFEEFDGRVDGDINVYLYAIGYKDVRLNPMNGEASYSAKVWQTGEAEYDTGNAEPTPPGEGYYFAGWYASRDYSGECIGWDFEDTYNVVKDGATYYAKWVKQ